MSPVIWKWINLQSCLIWQSHKYTYTHTHSSLILLCLPLSPPSISPARMPSLYSVDVFFRLEVQRLSCPQHVLVLRSAAARTCDDRVCERWGVSGVKCVYRGCMAGWGYVGDTPKNISFHLVTSCAEQTGQIGCSDEWRADSYVLLGLMYINNKANTEKKLKSINRHFKTAMYLLLKCWTMNSNL